jgi:hypothetical protein
MTILTDREVFVQVLSITYVILSKENKAAGATLIMSGGAGVYMLWASGAPATVYGWCELSTQHVKSLLKTFLKPVIEAYIRDGLTNCSKIERPGARRGKRFFAARYAGFPVAAGLP